MSRSGSANRDGQERDGGGQESGRFQRRWAQRVSDSE